MSTKVQSGCQIIWIGYGDCEPFHDESPQEPSESRLGRHGGYRLIYKPKKPRKKRSREEGQLGEKSSADALAQLLGDMRNARVTRERVLEITKQIFPGSSIQFDDATDPDSGVEFVQFTVAVNENTEKLLELNDRWHRELADMGNAGTVYCLSLMPSDESN